MNGQSSEETINKWHVECARQLLVFLPQCYGEKGLELRVTHPMQGIPLNTCSWLLNCHTAAPNGDT